jgi:hypothetical protein
MRVHLLPVGFSSPTQRISVSARLTAPAKEDAVKTSRERAEQKRLDKLDLIREQIESGVLVIRKMTEDERRRYPPRPEPPRRSGKR